MDDKFAMGMQNAAPTDFEDQSTLLSRAYIESIIRSILTEVGDQHVSRSRALPSKIKDNIYSSVRQLRSVNSKGLEENLGTIIFVKKDLAITCFHAIYQNSQIMEGSLRVDGKALQHIVSFPYYDMSFYKCPGREGEWLELGHTDSIGVGDHLYLASYPTILDVEGKNSNPIICSGSVCCIEDVTILGQYQCFPGSSGGAILSTSGKVIGMHLESVYHEDNSFLNAPDWYYECMPSETIRTLEWGNKTSELTNFCESVDSTKMTISAAQNVSSKGHLGRFQYVSTIRIKLLEEGLVPYRSKRRRCSF